MSKKNIFQKAGPGYYSGLLIFSLIYFLFTINSANWINQSVPWFWQEELLYGTSGFSIDKEAMETILIDTSLYKKIKLNGHYSDIIHYREYYSEGDSTIKRGIGEKWCIPLCFISNGTKWGYGISVSTNGMYGKGIFNKKEIPELTFLFQRGLLEAGCWGGYKFLKAALSFSVPFFIYPETEKKKLFSYNGIAGIDYHNSSLYFYYANQRKPPCHIFPSIYGREVNFFIIPFSQKIGLDASINYRAVAFCGGGEYSELKSSSLESRDGFSTKLDFLGKKFYARMSLNLLGCGPFFQISRNSHNGSILGYYRGMKYLSVDSIELNTVVIATGMNLKQNLQFGFLNSSTLFEFGRAYFEPFPFEAWAGFLAKKYKSDLFRTEFSETGGFIQKKFAISDLQNITIAFYISDMNIRDTMTYQERKQFLYSVYWYTDPEPYSFIDKGYYIFRPSIGYSLSFNRWNIITKLTQYFPLEKKTVDETEELSVADHGKTVMKTRRGGTFLYFSAEYCF